MNGRWVRLLGSGALGLGACQPIQYVDVVGGSGTASFPLPLEGEGGGGAEVVGAITGSVTELRYMADSEKRIYLVRGDLTAGLDPMTAPIPTLHFRVS